MKLNRRTLAGRGLIALALLVVAGGGLALAQGPGSSPLTDTDDDQSVAVSNVSLSEQEAIDIATAEVNGTVREVELESEDGTPTYEVNVVASPGSETEVVVHANDGTILETESNADEDANDNDEREEQEDEREAEENEPENQEDEDSVAPGNVSLSEQDAINIATAEVNGTVREVELENENGI